MGDWKELPGWVKLHEASDKLGVTDIWGQFMPFNDDELDRIVRCNEIYSMAKCAFDTHNAADVRVEGEYYNRYSLSTTVLNIVNSCEDAAFKRHVTDMRERCFK